MTLAYHPDTFSAYRRGRRRLYSLLTSAAHSSTAESRGLSSKAQYRASATSETCGDNVWGRTPADSIPKLVRASLRLIHQETAAPDAARLAQCNRQSKHNAITRYVNAAL